MALSIPQRVNNRNGPARQNIPTDQLLIFKDSPFSLHIFMFTDYFDVNRRDNNFPTEKVYCIQTPVLFRAKINHELG